MNFLENANKVQLEAITSTDGPLLILAGPGSGKTHVITSHIAYLISQGVSPYSILAITFTNKAAKEMAKRVSNFTGYTDLWISTFHSFCVKILRKNIHLLGYNSNFTIYDREDQERALKKIIKDLNITSDPYRKPSQVATIISKAKSRSLTPTQIKDKDYNQELARIYTVYESYLKESNALDFDDLLLKLLALFDNYKDVLATYQDKFQYILIDEFQDTNLPQYRIAKALASVHQNICVCGDPDQSIYGWRGANIGNILNFEQDFRNVKIVYLEQNYRSTPTILRAAASLISNNTMRKEKGLWTQNSDGPGIQVLELNDDTEEARTIAQEIQRHNQNGIDFSEMAVFYRVNSQSRVIEEALRKYNIPYTIVAGVAFFQRREVKDIISYLTLLNNPKDNEAFRRIINTPSRGIGKKTLSWLEARAKEKKLSLFETLSGLEFEKKCKKSQQGLKNFRDLFQELKKLPLYPVQSILNQVLEVTGYKDYIESTDTSKEEDRMSNVEEFIRSTTEYDQENPKGNLLGFLENIALVNDVDHWDKEKGQVNLMTIHSAKGLEFTAVFIAGVVDGLLPHFRSESKQELEEERRLLFVGMTRAKRNLMLTFTHYSWRGGEFLPNTPSDFIMEIKKEVTFSKDTGQRKQYSNKQEEDEPKGFKLGDRVEHDFLGQGTIIGFSGFGAKRIAQIEFDMCGIKELILKYADLKPGD